MQNRKRLSAEEIDSLLGEHQQSLEQYIKPYIHKKVDPITEHVYIVSEGDYVYNDLLQNNARGVCHAENGYIYFRDNVDITANLLIHEFVHRLSRNCINGEWVEGINNPPDGVTYSFNESITEMIAIDITGIREKGHPYLPCVDLVDFLCNKVGKTDLISAYFNSDLFYFNKILGKDYELFSINLGNLASTWSKANACDYAADDEIEFRELQKRIVAFIMYL